MQKPSTKNPKIVIVGGGASGYLTSLYINKLYPALEIKLIEDTSKPPIQVGESGNVLFTEALRFLDIDIDDWSNKTQNIIKLGGILKNWKGDRSTWFHSRVSHYQSLMTDKQDDLSYLKGLIKSDIPIYKTLLHGYSFDNGKVPYSPYKNYNWPSVMYHFDSRKNADYLKTVAIARGVNVIEARVQTVTQDVSGAINSIVLDSNENIDCDWVFDCTGLEKLILKKIMKVKFIDLSRYFLARSVITWIEAENIEHRFATDIIAREYGWQWSIDTKFRRGNGYVYCKDLLSEEKAILEIEKSLGKKINLQASFDWNIEYAEEIYKKNVIAVGLSSGFLEPLEANGILMIIKALNLVRHHWSPRGTKETIEIINDKMQVDLRQIVEFLAMHYQSDREDTEFWNEFKSDNYEKPFDLTNKLRDIEEFLFQDKSFLELDYSSYSPESWLMIVQATKNLKFDKKDSLSIENFTRISRQYCSLLDKSITLNEWLSLSTTYK